MNGSIRDTAHRGFTLVEVMIALVIFSMIMVAVLSGMRTLGRTSHTVEQMRDRGDDLRLVSRFLRDSIAAAMPVVRLGTARNGTIFEDGRYGTYFWGSQEEMIWVAPFAAGPVLGGTHVLRLSREGNALRLWWQPYEARAMDLAWNEEQSRLLLRHVDEFRLAYRRRYDEDWEQKWEGGRSNPVLVQVQLKVKGRYWPEIIVSLDQPRLQM